MEQHTLPASTKIVTTGEHYRIEGEAGRGGSAYCYRARSLHDSNYWCVLKEFAPRDMRPFLQRQTPQGPLVLMQPWLRSEYDRQLKHFREEVDRCSEVNEGDGLAGNNSPCILRSHFVPERDDLLRVDTEQGCTVYEYVNRFRPKGGLTADYIALCLELMVRLMDGLRQIHKSHLHLDISPKNIYIITPEPPLKAGNTYSVKLFDLASAQRKDVFTAAKIDGLRAQNPCTTYTQGYTHYSLRDFWTELEYDPEAAKTHAAERPIDERVDLFSVGAVLLFMLTGNQQIVADGNTEAIGFIRMEKRRYAALLPLLQELIAGAMQQSVRYAEPSQCDVRFRDDLWNARRAFLNEAGFSAIQIAGVCGSMTFPEVPQEDLMGRLKLADGAIVANLTAYVLEQTRSMCLSVTAEQGGAGKTFQLQHLYQTLLDTVPSAIPLLVPMGQLSGGRQPITRYICQRYCVVSEADQPALISLFNDHAHRWYLLLDAMDELPQGVSIGDELRTLTELCPDLTIIVTSRHRSYLLPESMIDAEILPLERTRVAQQFPDASARMLEVLSLPMLFRIASEVRRAEQQLSAVHSVYGTKDFAVGSYRVDSEGELLESYVNCQIAKAYQTNNDGKIARVLHEDLPKAAWESVQYGRNVRLGREARKIAIACGFIRENELSGDVSFTHERWHRFFRARYCWQLLRDAADARVVRRLSGKVWKVLKDEYLPEEICSLLGDLTRDYLRVPVQDPEGIWRRPAQDMPSTIDRVLEHLRGKTEVGYACANLINVMRSARKYDLSLADFSGLDLRKANLRGAALEHAGHASFRNACISEDAFCAPQLEECLDFAVWEHYFIAVSIAPQELMLDVVVYDMYGWYKCSELQVESRPAEQSVVYIPTPFAGELSVYRLSLTENSAGLGCSIQLFPDQTGFAELVLLTSQGLVHRVSVDGRGILAPVCQELPPTCFTFGGKTYLLPLPSAGPAWCSYRDVASEKAYICEWRFADYLGALYVWDEITEELSAVDLPDVGRIEDITVLISETGHLWFRFVHEGGVSVYQMTDDAVLVPVEVDANTLLPLSKDNWINRIVCKDGVLHYTLMGREAAAISSTTGALSGNPFINMSHACYSDAIRCVFGCVDYYDLLTTRSCVLRYDHPEEAAEYFDGRLVAVSPDQAFGLLVWQQGNRVALRLLDLQSRSEVCCLLDKASVGVQACWTKDRCIIRDRNGLYSLTIGSDRNIRLSPLIRFVTNRCWYFETQDEFMIEKYSYWSKQNVFGYELMARDDIMDWLEPEYKHSYLSLQEMNERFADRPSLKPRFLQIEGCDMRGIRIDEAQRPKLLDILRYNGAIVDDE